MTDAADGTVAVGFGALNQNTTGGNNVAVGFKAMYENTIGGNNTVVGFGAMDDSAALENNNNTFIGFNSGGGTWVNTASSQNTAVGSGSMLGAMDTSLRNTAIGYQALTANTTGTDNTCLGSTAGNTLTTGAENTILGANCDVASNDNTNNVIIGNNLTATDKDNAVFIGNNTNHIENDFNADATWNYSSDKRQKTDIKNDVLGLDFIKDLRPVTYKHKSPSEFPKEWSSYNADDKKPMGGDKVIHGLIAQEVKEALDKQGVDTFGGWSVGDDGRQRISAEKMVMPLIKAVQELSAKVESLEKQLKDK
tara:strand:- start:304 stop:1227 length:924 start_codon:yes stop_codon:yes gene_type:complete